MVYRHFCSLSNVGIRNKNKSKISLMSDLHLQSVHLLNKRKPIFTYSEKLAIQGDRKINFYLFDPKQADFALKSADFFSFFSLLAIEKPKK